MSLETANLVASISNWALIVSLVVGVVATFLVSWTSSVKEAHWQIDRQASNERIAKLNNDTEQLRTQNLNLQLRMKPRRIIMGSRDNDREVRQARFAEVAKHRGTFALIQAVPDYEAGVLARDIATALQNHGWKVKLANEAETRMANGLIFSGVTVASLEAPIVMPVPGEPIPQHKISAAGEASQAVVALLEMDLGPPHGPTFFGVHWAPQYEGMSILTRDGFKFPEGAVVILVGMRPLEYGIP